MSDNPSRRAFMVAGGAAAAATALPASALTQSEPEPGEPRITDATLAEAEKLAAIEFTLKERTEILTSIGDEIDRYRRRRTVELPNGLGPATVFDARSQGNSIPDRELYVGSGTDPGPLASDDASIAYAPVTALST